MAKTSIPYFAAAHILPQLRADNKNQALQEIARLAATAIGPNSMGVNEHAVFDTLFAREKLATTGVGYGIAIPHGKMDGLDRVYGFFARAEHPIEFESIDGKPVDLIFMLLAPQDAGADHLKALAKISRMFRNTAFADRLRKTEDAKAIFALFSAQEKESEAAA